MKKGLISVIKNEGSNNYLIWKHPIEDFYNKSVLIVSEAECALFYNEGIIEKIFDSGKYMLGSANIPISTDIIKKFTAGKSPFHCKIFFISKTEKLDIKWGTSSPIRVEDSKYHFIVSIVSNGSYSFRIKEPKKLIVKLLNTNIEKVSFLEIGAIFRDYFGAAIREILHSVLLKEQITIYQIESQLREISQMVYREIKPLFEEYGMELTRFIVNEIVPSGSDHNYDAISKAYADSAVVRIQGADFERITTAEAMINASKNEGVNGAPIGLTTGLIVGNMVGQKMSKREKICSMCGQINIAEATYCCNCGQLIANQEIICSKCGNANQSNSTFCCNCGNRLKP